MSNMSSRTPQKSKRAPRFIGIDPGTSRVGYGVVEVSANGPRLVVAGILPGASRSRAGRLAEIHRELLVLLDKHRPAALGIEQLFFSNNQRTAMAVAEARGVLLLGAAERRIDIVELSPREVKFGIAGYGGADKRAVLKMVRLILREPELRVVDDASDALALAILASGKRIGGAG